MSELVYAVPIKNLKGEEGWRGHFKTIEEAKAWGLQQMERPNRLKENVDDVIIDLSKNLEYLQKVAISNRRKEGPTLEEKIDALIAKERGDLSKLQEVVQKIQTIETKYPIPTEVKNDFSISR